MSDKRKPDLVKDAPLIPLDVVMLDGESWRDTIRRLRNEAERKRLEERYGSNWNRRLRLTQEKLPGADLERR